MKPAFRKLLAQTSLPGSFALTRRNFLRNTAWAVAGTCALPALAEEPKAEKTSKTAKFKPKPDPYADAVLVSGELAPIAPGSFTIVALPDSQHYHKNDPSGYLAQTEWVVRNQKARNIAAVVHLGDITNNNLHDQWKLAAQAHQKLEGKVPCFMSLGNHDYGEKGGGPTRTTFFNEYFPLAKHGKAPTFGGVYDREPEKMENSYHLLTAGGRDLIVLCLEYGPRKDVVRWANSVMEKHAKRSGILVTHAYMYNDDTRYNWAKRGAKQSWNPHASGFSTSSGDDVTDGEELWQQLVSKHNFFLTLNGHVLGDGLGRLTSEANGRRVHQLLFNCQMKPKGGDGWLRVLEFKADGKTINVCDFSTTRKERNESRQNKFTLTS
jgi:3',5'-cyclic AMP phosphodiesterase CpdA